MRDVEKICEISKQAIAHNTLEMYTERDRNIEREREHKKKKHTHLIRIRMKTTIWKPQGDEIKAISTNRIVIIKKILIRRSFYQQKHAHILTHTRRERSHVWERDTRSEIMNQTITKSKIYLSHNISKIIE